MTGHDKPESPVTTNRNDRSRSTGIPIGGDEFVIVFPDTPIARAAVMCRGIIDSIDTLPYQVGGNAFHVRGSIGLIEVGAGMQFNDAMSTADRACRQAKSGSSGGLVVYEKNAVAFKQHEAELKLIALLATSSATDRLYLEMQPIMSLTKPHESLNSLGIGTTGSQVPYQSLDRGHATYMPSTSRAVSRTPPDFVPRHGECAVLMEFLEFTTLHGCFTFVRLFDPYLTGFYPCLLASALTTRALYPRSLRWFAPCSCKPGHEGPSLIFDKASRSILTPFSV